MDYSDRFLGQRIVDNLNRRVPSGFYLTLVLVAGALGLGLLNAYLIVYYNWYMAVVVILAVPAIILLLKYPILGLMVWLLITPYLIAIDSSSLRRVYWIIHRALPPIIIAVIVLDSSLGISRRKLPKLGWIELVMFGYVVVSLSSIFLLSEDPIATSYQYYDRVIIPMCLYLIVRLLAPHQEVLRRLLPVLFFLCLTQAIFGVIYVVARDLLPSYWIRESGERATGSLLSPSVYGTTLIFAALLLLHAALSLKSEKIRTFRPLLIGVFILAMIGVFFTFSRASWIAGIVVIVGCIYLYPKFMFRIALVATPVVLLLAGRLLASQLGFASVRVNSSESALSRLPVVLASLRMFEAKPAFGWGYGNFDDYDLQFQGRVGDLVSPEKDHASHNLYLTILAEQGATGLILYLVPAIGLLVLSIKKWSYLPSHGFWSKKLLLIFWLVILSHVIVNNFSNMRRVFGLGIWWITLAFIATIVIGANQSATNDPAAVRSGEKSE